MRLTLVVLAVIGLIWDMSPTPGVQYQVKEQLQTGWKDIGRPVASNSATISTTKGTHTYAVVAVKDGMESTRSNSVSVRVKH